MSPEVGFRAVGAAARWKEEGKAELNFRPCGFLGSREQLPLPPQDEALSGVWSHWMLCFWETALSRVPGWIVAPLGRCPRRRNGEEPGRKLQLPQGADWRFDVSWTEPSLQPPRLMTLNGEHAQPWASSLNYVRDCLQCLIIAIN